MSIEKYSPVLNTLSSKNVVDELRISEKEFVELVAEGRYGELVKKIEFDVFLSDKKTRHHVFAYIHDDEFCIVASKSKISVPILDFIKKKIGDLKLVITDTDEKDSEPFKDMIKANIIDWRVI